MTKKEKAAKDSILVPELHSSESQMQSSELTLFLALSSSALTLAGISIIWPLIESGILPLIESVRFLTDLHPVSADPV